jgi:hypothetical protein
MMDRPHFDLTIDALENIVAAHKHSRVVLAQVLEELQYREGERVARLRRDIEALLSGEIAMPRRPTSPDDPNSQIPLM